MSGVELTCVLSISVLKVILRLVGVHGPVPNHMWAILADFRFHGPVPSYDGSQRKWNFARWSEMGLSYISKGYDSARKLLTKQSICKEKKLRKNFKVLCYV